MQPDMTEKIETFLCIFISVLIIFGISLLIILGIANISVDYIIHSISSIFLFDFTILIC